MDSSIKTYIDKFIQNLPIDITSVKTPLKMDLILDIGFFNGSYTLGALYFLKEMEHQKFIKIERISGCSIGAVLGIFYFSDKLDLFNSLYEQIVIIFKNNHNIKNYKTILYNIFADNTDNDNLDFCNKIFKKLFISYNNLKTGKKVLKNKYKDINDLLETTIKSFFVPFLLDGKISYKHKYIDGINPYIFKNKNKKILFLNLVTIDKITSIINVKNERSSFHRVLTGLLEIHSFFIKGSETPMCSYVNNWGIINHTIFWLRLIFERILLFFIYILKICDNHILKYYSKNILVVILKKILNDVYIIVLDYYCL
jgi:hypothetical protein